MNLAEQVCRMNGKCRRRGQGYLLTMGIVCVVDVALTILGTRHWGWGFLLEGMLSWGLLLGVGCGLLIDSLRQVRKGLLVAPTKPATVRLESSWIVLVDGLDEVHLPLTEVCGATLLFQDLHERVWCIDDALRIHLKNGQDLVVGSSTEGLGEVLTWLDHGGRLVREGVFFDD